MVPKDIAWNKKPDECSTLIENLSKEKGKRDHVVVLGDGKTLTMKQRKVIIDKTALEEEEVNKKEKGKNEENKKENEEEENDNEEVEKEEE